MNDFYRPPGAPVEDPPAPAVKHGRRPWPISLASVFIVLVIVDRGAQLLRGNHFDFGVGMLMIAALASIALMLERGRNWARWVLLCIAALKLLKLALMLFAPAVPAGVHLAIDYAAVIRELAAGLCLMGAAVLVFVPGRAWFERGGS